MNKKQKVRLEELGIGDVLTDLGDTVVVRFGDEIRECAKGDLRPVEGVLDCLRSGTLHSPLQVVLRCQAECIRSINDMWGLFARSRITLLPHQLWVCRKVLSTFPNSRWLVADDVGLGKTVEAGLILSALMTRQQVKRLLVICPASLKEQWQYRLRSMFDIRTAVYAPNHDTPKSDYWNSQSLVVASMQSLRLDRKGRHDRLVRSEPWDLILVDEAHHLNADEHGGPTLGFRLIQKMQDAGKIRSMVFFTGTPHRGKPFGFLSLLSLLQPDNFDPRRPIDEQLSQLPNVMIRNNKQNVTNLSGDLLFQNPVVDSRTYSYSEDEQAFYEMLTNFIMSGKAYANEMGGRDGRAVMLVLISMQKLASSSVAAILRALQGRLNKVADVESVEAAWGIADEVVDAETRNDFDVLNGLDERLAEAALLLNQNEKTWLERLIAAGERIDEETKIIEIVGDTLKLPSEESVLFFTEYKATQSLLMSVLIQQYGPDQVAFINGDGEARDVCVSGNRVSIRKTRTAAAEAFNAGTVRFLVSTEAAGEGIDLQDNCRRLVHVDLPWNPMRLHQRVGRLNRYGQKKQVYVTSYRNPLTVESRIWEKLNEKIDHINVALRQVMPNPEDMFQLVLGMTSPATFNQVFSEAGSIEDGAFDDWFDAETTSFGSSDVVDTVRELIGHSARFDFQQVSDRLPKVTLNDLRPFFTGSLIENHRKPRFDGEVLAFKTPESWLTVPAIQLEYNQLTFNCETMDLDGLLGIGHRLLDKAIDEAVHYEASVCVVSGLNMPTFVCRVFDRVTAQECLRQSIICGVELDGMNGRCLSDWELLMTLNPISPFRLKQESHAARREKNISYRFNIVTNVALQHATALGLELRTPYVEVVCCLLPEE